MPDQGLSVDISVPPATRYSAFISYSHHDAAFARRLHRRLETYRLPRRLHGAAARVMENGRLKPVFRDKEEFGASADLTLSVRAAIAEADHLIVVCSEHASRSEWVHREIALFRELRGQSAIFAVLADGAAEHTLRTMFRNNNESEPALEPLAADFGRFGDGRRLAFLKLVAGLAGIRLDQLVQRDAQRRLRQMTAVAAALFAGVLAMGALTLVAVNARAKAEQERIRGENLVEYLLSDLRHKLKGVGRLDVLNIVNQGALAYYRGQNLGYLSQAALLQRAKLLQDIADDDELQGDLSGAQAQAQEAARTTALLLRASPNDQHVIFAQAQSDYWLGFVCWRMADDACAHAHFIQYAVLARRLGALDSRNPDWLLEIGYADSNLGMFALRTSKDTAQAERLFSLALAHFKAATFYRPNDHDIQYTIADTYAWLSDVYRVKGAFTEALHYRFLQRQSLEGILRQDPRDFDSRQAMAYNVFSVARIGLAQGRLQDAISGFDEAVRSDRLLNEEVPENKKVSTQIRLIELFKVRAWLAMRAADRPALAALAKIVGDCSAEKAEPHNDELFALCMAIRARILLATGAVTDGSPLPELPVVPPLGDRLTERWLLDLSAGSTLN